MRGTTYESGGRASVFHFSSVGLSQNTQNLGPRSFICVWKNEPSVITTPIVTWKVRKNRT